MGYAEGHACLSEKRRSEIRQTHWTGHAEGRARSLSAEQRSEIRQTNQTGHAAGVTRLSEEQHAENGVHHLNLLLLNHFSSNFVFVITYHAARQIMAAVGSNELFISFHVLGSVDAMLRFIHAIGSLKLAVLVPVHACIQRIILVFTSFGTKKLACRTIYHIAPVITHFPSDALVVPCLDTLSARDARIVFISELPSVMSTGSILKQ